MKTARFVLKIVAASLALASAVCAIVGFWDKIAGKCCCCCGDDCCCGEEELF